MLTNVKMSAVKKVHYLKKCFLQLRVTFLSMASVTEDAILQSFFYSSPNRLNTVVLQDCLVLNIIISF